MRCNVSFLLKGRCSVLFHARLFSINTRQENGFFRSFYQFSLFFLCSLFFDDSYVILRVSISCSAGSLSYTRALTPAIIKTKISTSNLTTMNVLVETTNNILSIDNLNLNLLSLCSFTTYLLLVELPSGSTRSASSNKL